MRFTISHAIAAYPVHHLTRRKIPVMPVVIGSMSPDFPYLLFYDPRARARAFNSWCLDLLFATGIVDACALVSVAGKTHIKFAGAASGPNAVKYSRGAARDFGRTAWRL
ncbi:MAG: DUF4184 family protein [Rheinheimera sp.]|nr:DUF4184 family protein [Rheinheimera sp.]